MLSSIPGIGKAIVPERIYGYMMVQKSDGSVWGWGTNYVGGSEGTRVQVPTLIGDCSNTKGIFLNLHSLFITKEDGTLWAKGTNSYGSLGIGNRLSTYTFKRVNLADAASVSTSDNATNARTLDGKVYGWGFSNTNGQIGDGTTTSRLTPVILYGFDNVVKVAHGEDHGIALKADRTVYSWGFNRYGVTGLGTESGNQLEPRRIEGLPEIVDIANYRTANVALDREGRVWYWGKGLPKGSTSTPELIEGFSDIVSVAMGTGCVFGLRADGSLYVCGSNISGGLGLGSTANQNSAVLCDVTDVVAVVGGNGYNYIVKKDGTLWGAGDNSIGQLGLGDTTDRTTFTYITDLIVGGGTDPDPDPDPDPEPGEKEGCCCCKPRVHVEVPMCPANKDFVNELNALVDKYNNA